MGVMGNDSTRKARRFAMASGLVGRGAAYDFGGSGAPTNGSSGTGAGFAEVGSIYYDWTGGTGAWINVGTEAAPVWSPMEAVPYAVSSANILAMNGTPVTLIAAPPAGYCLLVYAILFEMTPSGTAYASGGTVQFQYHGGAVVHTGTIPASVVNAAGTTVSLTSLGSASASNGTTVPTATGVDITNNTGAFTTGTGTAKAYIAYSVIKQ